MPATVQLNTRIDPELKRSGDAVFARAGLTPSEVVRAVWAHAARTQSVPECVLDESAGTLRFAITGSVETTSPTGKERTYLYHAKVDVDGKAAKLAALDVAPREE